MGFVDAGYDGTVDEVQFAKLLNRYAVVGADDFKATNTTGDRMLSISDGTALGPGTLNVGTAFSPLQFDAVTSGTTRWDLVVLRRNWQPAAGNTSIVIIKGTASKALPTPGTSTTQWNQRPGILDDQPLYLQQVNAGSTSLGTRADLRVWQGPGGAMVNDRLALEYLKAPGARVNTGLTTWTYMDVGNGVWDWVSPATSYPPITPPNGYSADGRVVVERVADGLSRVTVDISIKRTGSGFVLGTAFTGLGAVLPTATRGNSEAKYLSVAFSGGSGGNNVLGMAAVFPANGQILIRGQESFTWATGALFTVNCTYYI